MPTLSKDLSAETNVPVIPAWAKQAIAAISIIAASIGGAVGVQSTVKPAVAIAPAIEEVQKAQAEMTSRISTLERMSDRQAASVENIVTTLGQLVNETRENSAQVQRMVGALEQMQK